jgi:DNA-binding transcriptional MocR family regulator
VLHTEGGWSAIVQLPKVLSEEAWVRRLLDAGVIAQPGYFFDMPSESFVIVSLITPPGNFNEGAERIRTLVREVIDTLHGDNLHEGLE